MRELIEFRIPEDNASKLLPPDRGVRLGDTVRKLVLTLDDPLCDEIEKLDLEAQKQGRAYYTYWNITRHYTAAEVDAADVFQLTVIPRHEPTGEECGTIYDESNACPQCGAGRTQVSDLVLNITRLPKGKDIAKTIANELVVNKRLADLMGKYKITGVELRSVRHWRPSTRTPSPWFQLVAKQPLIRIASQTRFGESPFDGDFKDRFRCPSGHVVGLNLVSDLWIDRDSWSGNDFAWTQEQVGVKRGLLRPAPMMMISPKFFRLLRDQKIKGWDFEIAHLV